MEIFGSVWKNHEKKIEKFFRKLVNPEDTAEKYKVEQAVYSHCHGRARFDDSFKGYVNGIECKLVSGDYLKFRPERILD